MTTFVQKYLLLPFIVYPWLSCKLNFEKNCEASPGLMRLIITPLLPVKSIYVGLIVCS